MKRMRPELLEKMGEAMFDYVGECNKRRPTGEGFDYYKQSINSFKYHI